MSVWALRTGSLFPARAVLGAGEVLPVASWWVPGGAVGALVPQSQASPGMAASWRETGPWMSLAAPRPHEGP